VTATIAPGTVARDRIAQLCTSVGIANVYRSPVNAIAPPCAVLMPGSPYVTPELSRWCGYVVRVDVLLVVGAIDDRHALDKLDALDWKLREAAAGALCRAGELSAGVAVRVGGIDYLAAALALETETERGTL
jgi:hypothetical protein